MRDSSSVSERASESALETGLYCRTLYPRTCLSTAEMNSYVAVADVPHSGRIRRRLGGSGVAEHGVSHIGN